MYRRVGGLRRVQPIPTQSWEGADFASALPAFLARYLRLTFTALLAARV